MIEGMAEMTIQRHAEPERPVPVQHALPRDGKDDRRLGVHDDGAGLCGSCKPPHPGGLRHSPLFSEGPLSEEEGGRFVCREKPVSCHLAGICRLCRGTCHLCRARFCGGNPDLGSRPCGRPSLRHRHAGDLADREQIWKEEQPVCRLHHRSCRLCQRPQLRHRLPWRGLSASSPPSTSCWHCSLTFWITWRQRTASAPTASRW